MKERWQRHYMHGKNVATGEETETHVTKRKLKTPKPPLPVPEAVAEGTPAQRAGSRRVLLDDGAAEVAVHRRTELRAGHAIVGPALVDQDDTTTFVPRGWRGQVHAAGSLVLERSA